MKIGVFQFSTDYAVHPAELARAVEERGFESLFFPEHTHIPASRKSPWPGGPDLPKDYWHTNDLFVALAMAAAVTKKIMVGSGICLVIERDPIVMAKEVATLDHLSNGRVLFGIGGGWNAEEMENHGTSFKGRFKVMRERVQAMKAIWKDEEAEFHGDTVKFDKIWSYPKPKQTPHPPILVGGSGGPARQRVVDYGDAWLPIIGRGEPLADALADLHVRAEKAGRDPKSIGVTIFGVKPDKNLIDDYEKQGVERVLLPLPAAGTDAVMPLLDGYAKLLG